MSLYDRNYVQNSSAQESFLEQNPSALSAFVKQTYALLTASMIAATAGAYIGMNVVVFQNPIIYLIVMLGLLFVMNYATKARNNTLALVLLFAFTFATGLSIGPVINYYVSSGAGSVVTQAFLMTAIAFGGLTVYAMNTKTEFGSWGKPLLFSLIAIIIASLLNYFLFKSTFGALIISSISAMLFCGFILYDTQNIIKGRYDSPIMAAVGMYLNILNLFISLLNILGISRD